MKPLVVSLDPDAARHLARALEANRRWCTTNGHRLPPALADLALLATAGQDRTNGRAGDDFAHDASMTPLLLTYAEAAERLRVSERTVRRLVDAGDLPSVVVGTRPRVHSDDLTAYAAGLRTKNQIGATA